MPKNKVTYSVGDYLKSIYTLCGDSPVYASTTAMAETLRISAPSVTGMFKKLSTAKLVNYDRYNGVRLTPSGRKSALTLIRRHRLMELFLHRCLAMSWEEIHEEAEVLEHVISDKLEKQIDRWLGSPQFDPHGAPIPDAEGRIVERQLTSLVMLLPKKQARVAEIWDEDSELLKYLREKRLTPGRRITLLEREPFGGNLKLRVSRRVEYIGEKAAKAVFVELL